MAISASNEIRIGKFLNIKCAKFPMATSELKYTTTINQPTQLKKMMVDGVTYAYLCLPIENSRRASQLYKRMEGEHCFHDDLLSIDVKYCFHGYHLTECFTESCYSYSVNPYTRFTSFDKNILDIFGYRKEIIPTKIPIFNNSNAFAMQATTV